MRGLTSRGAEEAACNVNSIAGPLAACGMACGGAILSAPRAMEPWSQGARFGAWRLRWITCGRAHHSLSSVSVVVVLVHFVCRSAHRVVNMPRIDRSVSGRGALMISRPARSGGYAAGVKMNLILKSRVTKGRVVARLARTGRGDRCETF